MTAWKVFAGVLITASIAACSGGNPSGPAYLSGQAPAGSSPGDPQSTGLTFHRDVEPILQDHCEGCHSPDNIAPFSLMTYAQASAWAADMATQTSQRLMPPWGAPTTGDCKPPFPWKNDISLSDAQIATIQAWSVAGAPEGNPSDAPPPRTPAPQALESMQLDLTPRQPFVAGGDRDEFHCFVLDPRTTALQYVNGVFFVAGNPKVVHHAALLSDPTGASLSVADATGGYDCFSLPRVPKEALLGLWAPGGTPIELPSHIGTPLPAGSKLILQIHYHPAGVEAAAADLTHVQLRFSSVRPDYILGTTGVGNYPRPLPGGDGLQQEPDDPPTGPVFLIPANAKGHVEEMQLTVPTPTNGQPWPSVWFYGLMPHMHLAGQAFKVDLIKAGGTLGGKGDSCLLEDPNWRFAWQRFYAYDAPIAELPLLAPGDKIRVRCVYDNTTDNQQLEASLMATSNGIPVDIHLGEQTTDEMCLAIPQVLVTNTL